MLVLSRKVNESIVINDDVTIVVVAIRGDKVRLGVEAPKECAVHRNEVYEAIRRNIDQQQSARLTPLAGDCPYLAESAELNGDCPPTQCVIEAPREAPTAVAQPPARDGLCCPQCGSDAVEVARIKVAYQGKELVRRRKCDVCSNEFHTVERVELL